MNTNGARVCDPQPFSQSKCQGQAAAHRAALQNTKINSRPFRIQFILRTNRAVSISFRHLRFFRVAGSLIQPPRVFPGRSSPAACLLHNGRSRFRAAIHRIPWPRRCLQAFSRLLQTADFWRDGSAPRLLTDSTRENAKIKSRARPARSVQSFRSTLLKISPSWTRVRKFCPRFTSFARWMIFPVATSIVIE